MMSWLIFKSFTQLEFIQVYGISWWYSFFAFFFLHIPVQISQHNLLKKVFYSILWACPFCEILINHTDMGLFLGSLCCSIDPCVCSYASTRLFWLQWPYSIVCYQVLWFLQFCSSFPRLLWLFGVFILFYFIYFILFYTLL